MRRLSLVSDLVVFLANLGDDLQRLLSAGHVEPDAITAAVNALRAAADDLHHGRSPSLANLQSGPASDDIPF